MTDHEELTAQEYLRDLLSSDPRLTRWVAVDALCETFALTEQEASQVWKDRKDGTQSEV